MTAEADEVRASLLHYSYAQLPMAFLGSAASAALVAAFIARQGWQSALLPWLVGHGLLACAGLLVVRAWRVGSLKHSQRLALILRRVAGVSTGLLWGAAGLLWPLASGDAGLGILFCVTGLAAAGSSTSAADPSSAISFNVLAFLPPLVLEASDNTWLSALLVLYLSAITVVCLRNHRLLKLSLSLRWENAQLLEQARAEQRLTLLEKQRAETAVAARTRFLAAASHDLRQPVQALSLFSDVLAHQTDDLKRAEVIAAVGRTSQALSAMLDSLLDISRLDAGLAAPNPSPVSIARLLEDIASSLQTEAEARDMVMQVAARDCRVWADRTMVARVVQNLAVNAVRHGGGRVLLSSRLRPGHCLVQVWDQGPGIADQDQERIFDELVQLDNRERDRAKGLGLGLSMARRLCELNQWSLTLRSRLGKGTVFTLKLPLSEHELPALRRKGNSDARALSILFVEDDPDVRQATCAWLESNGCTLQATDHAEAGLTLWRTARAQGRAHDALVTDHDLPGEMSGAALALSLRCEAPRLPVVIITGAETLPFDGTPPPGIVIMRKPVRGEDLWQTIRGAVDAMKTG